jgi:uncharacterized protein (DUF488 family)
MPLTIWTIGHSNRELADFLDLLTAERIESLGDVRRFPGSRRHPHFNREVLDAALCDARISYHHFPALGGRRTKRADSTQNAAWHVAAFAAFADYMQTEEFARAFDELATLATQSRTAVMCAEALPWQCHRRLIADQFVAHHWQVWDIIGPANKREHTLPPFAKITGGQLTYPAQ